MSYKISMIGPGDIAALPPTIGATSRAPTIGAADVGKPITKTFPMGTEPNAEQCPISVSRAIGGAALFLALGFAVGYGWTKTRDSIY